jgi:hypothetical protein
MSSTRETLDEIHRVTVLLEATQQNHGDVAGLYDKFILAEILDACSSRLLMHIEMDRCCGDEGDGLLECGRVCGHCLRLDKDIAFNIQQTELKWEAAA